MLTVVAPAAITASTTWQRKATSVRVASSGENSTSAQRDFACRTASRACSRHFSRVMRSLYLRRLSEVARKMVMRGRSIDLVPPGRLPLYFIGGEGLKKRLLCLQKH